MRKREQDGERRWGIVLHRLATSSRKRSRDTRPRPEWAIEPKWDGWRCAARVDGRIPPNGGPT
jgi:ATP-dependent DNA ligase